MIRVSECGWWLLYILHFHFFSSLCPFSQVIRLAFLSVVQRPAMSLVVTDPLFSPFHNLPISTHRSLHRQSSCSSIPRSVSICSSLWGFDFSSEDFRNPPHFHEATYMSPLFCGLEEIGVTHRAEEHMSSIPPEGFTGVKPARPDDSLSDSHSDYKFDIVEHGPESEFPNEFEGNAPGEQSPARAHPHLPLMVETQPGTEASLPPLPADPAPSLDLLPPPLPPKATRRIPPRTGTRPLHTDRSKGRQQSGSRPQQIVHTEVPYGRPHARPVFRAATQLDLREAYMRANPLSEQNLYARGIMPIRQPILHPLPVNPNANATEVMMILVV
jgi:hypothetical protein